MATETGVITSIKADRASAVIEADLTGKSVETTDVAENLAIADGVDYTIKEGSATKLKEITRVSIDGKLTDDEMKSLNALVKSLNARGGDGGIKIKIKTRK